MELAYACHINARRLQQTATAINVPAAFRMQILRLVQRHIDLAISLGGELSLPDPDAFITKESAEAMAEKLGLFD